MSTNDVLSKLKAEMEKRKHICDGVFERDSDTYYQGKAVAYQETLAFIASLQPEQLNCHTVEDWIQHIQNADQLTKDIFSKGPYDVLYDALNYPYQYCYDAIKEFGELCFQTGVNSVKQEQPCDTCTNDKGCVTCKDGELWEGKEQPSEDLDAEIEMQWDSFNKHLAEYDGESEDVVWLNRFSFEDIANYFYKLGKQAKEE